MGKLFKEKKKDEANAKRAESKALDAKMQELVKKVQETKLALEAKLNHVGNIVHPSCPISKDEHDNDVVKTWGEFKKVPGLYHHHQILYMIGGFEPIRGSNVAGHRGYYLTGPGVALNQALINYGMKFLAKREYTPIQTPFFMNKDVMGEVAQLEQFDEELYKVTGNKDAGEQYLIATSEQPICAYHRGERLDESELPLKYAGYSTCFRKEAGSSGKDVWGIFRIHQFEKIEQFCITTPEKSWEMHEAMLKASEDFYQSLNLPYHIVCLVSGELNNAAAKKYDLEAWFPGSQLTEPVHRELVSCSNCTDYQARRLEIRCGQPKQGDRGPRYVHMLNSTLTATERTICCILENYQDLDEEGKLLGVKVPEVLQPYTEGFLKDKAYIPVVREAPKHYNTNSLKKGKGKKH